MVTTQYLYIFSLGHLSLCNLFADTDAIHTLKIIFIEIKDSNSEKSLFLSHFLQT